jgi:hypothetical protein
LTLSTTTFLTGLVVIVNPNVEDYFYTTRSTEGFNVSGSFDTFPLVMFLFYCFQILIYNPHDYPDVNSGNLRERYVTRGTRNFLSLVPRTILASDTIRSFTPHQVVHDKFIMKKDFHVTFMIFSEDVSSTMKFQTDMVIFTLLATALSNAR